MPSWFETTGLASLEAGLCGASIVSTDRGHAREYFGTMARYCDPSSPHSIRSAIEAALSTAQSDDLRKHIAGNFTWAHTAAKTVEAYEALLEGRTHARDSGQI